MESKKWVQMNFLQNRSRVTEVENKLLVTGGMWGGDKPGDMD